jgi:protein TonB
LDLDVDELRGLKPGDLPALTPPADAIKTGTSPIAGTEIDPRGGEPDRLANSAVMAGHIVSKVPPRYPQEAKQRRAQGSVRISATIGKDGLVRNAVVVHDPDEALSKAALDAVKQWRYTPYLLNGEPVDVRTYIRVTFTIGG